MYFVYFLKSQRHEKFYVGMTAKDPKVRVLEYNNDSNVWTRQNGPFILVYYEEYLCKQDALKRERFYKTGFGRKIRDAILKTI